MGETESALQTLRGVDDLAAPLGSPDNLVDNLSKAGRHREADASSRTSGSWLQRKGA
jgi:hypothetical protein